MVYLLAAKHRFVLKFLGTILLLVSFIPVLNMWLIDGAALFGFTITPLKDWFYFIALIIGMHMYVTVMIAFWRDRLTTDIVQVLPWDLIRLQTSFLKWAYPGISIFFLPMYLYAINHVSLLFILQMLIALLGVSFLLYWKMIEAFQLVSKNESFTVPQTFTVLGYSLYVTIILSVFMPKTIVIGLLLVAVVGSLHIKTYQTVKTNVI